MAKKTVTNWGNYPKIEAEVIEVDFAENVGPVIKEKRSIIARGNGRCYGDVSLGENIISTLKLNRILSFDERQGHIRCQAGVLLSEILDFIVPKGFFIPVTPGTKFITVGGAIASDVHGKNHHVDGCFSNHVLNFTLIDEQGEEQRVSPTENSRLYWETVGGMGRTGVIVEASFRLRRIETAYIRTENIKAGSLEEMMELFEDSEHWTYSVAWMDCLKRGAAQGRGILMRGEHATPEELSPRQRRSPLRLKSKRRLNVPKFFPGFLLNQWTVKIFNFLFYHKQLKRRVNKIVHYESFFYPLDAILNWNRIYGKQGFTQYQFVIPKKHGKEGLIRILNTISEAGEGSFLVVLKLFGKNNPKAKWSFPMEGYTLALDFKINAQTPQLIERLDALVMEYGGRVYLSKDAFSCRALSNLPDRIDTKFISLQAKRLLRQ